MSALYDIVISVAIGGIVLAMLITFNGNIVEEASGQTIRMMAQTDLTAVIDVVDFEFRKMGYNLSGSDSAIVYADSSKIKFRGDFNNNGTVQTLTYYLDPTAASGHANKNTRILYRAVDAEPAQTINLGITRFRLAYFDKNGIPFTGYPVSKPSQIKSFKIVLNIESTVPYKASTEKYIKFNPGVYWERTFKPKNIR